jgi:hypothetical protein
MKPSSLFLVTITALSIVALFPQEAYSRPARDGDLCAAASGDELRIGQTRCVADACQCCWESSQAPGTEACGGDYLCLSCFFEARAPGVLANLNELKQSLRDSIVHVEPTLTDANLCEPACKTSEQCKCEGKSCGCVPKILPSRTGKYGGWQ